GSQAQAPLQMLRGRNSAIAKRLSSPTPTVTPGAPPIQQIVATMSKLASAATLRAHPPSIDVGQRVLFELIFPQSPPTSPYIHYGFDFDDDSGMQWTVEPRAVHPYDSHGTHHASAVIRVGETLLRQNIFRADVDVRPRSSPTATATASVPRSTPTPTRTATSVPTTASPYSPSPTATATAGTSITASPPSSPVAASPTATWSPYRRSTETPTPVVSAGGLPPENTSWTNYIVRAGLAIVGAGLAAAALFGILTLIKPTFRLHWNRDEPQRPLENLTINYELHFYSNVSAGQDRLDIPGANLIL